MQSLSQQEQENMPVSAVTEQSPAVSHPGRLPYYRTRGAAAYSAMILRWLRKSLPIGLRIPLLPAVFPVSYSRFMIKAMSGKMTAHSQSNLQIA